MWIRSAVPGRRGAAEALGDDARARVTFTMDGRAAEWARRVDESLAAWTRSCGAPNLSTGAAGPAARRARRGASAARALREAIASEVARRVDPLRPTRRGRAATSARARATTRRGRAA